MSTHGVEMLIHDLIFLYLLQLIPGVYSYVILIHAERIKSLSVVNLTKIV